VKKKIETIEYNIIPISPHLSPYATRIGELLQKKPQSVQEVEETSGEINVLMDKLLSETVKPKPTKEHQTQVFNILCEYTNAVIQEAQFFRKNKGSNSAKGNTARHGDSEAAK